MIDISNKPTNSFKKFSANEDTKQSSRPFVVPTHWSTLHSSRFDTQSTTPLPNVDTQRRNDHSDLKVSSSQDSRRSQNEHNFETNQKPTPKPLEVEYQPPFLHPIFNQNFTTKAPLKQSTGFNFDSSTYKSIKEINDNLQNPQANVINRNPVDFTQNILHTTPSTFINNGVNNEPNQIEARIRGRPSSFENTASTVPQPSQPTPFHLTTPNVFSPIPNEVPLPPLALLPPFENFHIYDDATTQGPPIYYEWKIPASGLEPPLLEFKDNNEISSIDGNQNQVPVIPPEAKKPAIAIPFLEKELVPPIFETSSSLITQIKVPADGLQPPQAVFNYTPQPTHSFPSVNAVLHNFSAVGDNKSQTQRSVSSSSINANNGIAATESSKRPFIKDLNYLDLKKEFSIPEFTFPLETHPGPGYDNNNSVNSFQIKIPDQITNENGNRKPWYGENAQCPECHPSFLKPGSCEPCIKIR